MDSNIVAGKRPFSLRELTPNALEDTLWDDSPRPGPLQHAGRGRTGHGACTSQDAGISSDRDLLTPQHRAEGCHRGKEPTQLWKARKCADIWQITQSRIVRHVVIGTFSSAKQSYFCLREDYSLQTKMLSNLVSLKTKEKKKALSLASASLAYSHVKSPYRQEGGKKWLENCKYAPLHNKVLLFLCQIYRD